MTSSDWTILDEIGAKAGGSPVEIDGMLSAAMELVADVLPNADQRLLSEGSLAAAHALARLMTNNPQPVNRGSADFQAGRLAAIIDILGYAASATCSNDMLDKARAEPCASVIRLLAGGGLMDADIGAHIGADAGAVALALADLRLMGMATTQTRGTEVYNVLTPAGSLVAQECVGAQASPGAA